MSDGDDGCSWNESKSMWEWSGWDEEHGPKEVKPPTSAANVGKVLCLSDSASLFEGLLTNGRFQSLLTSLHLVSAHFECLHHALHVVTKANEDGNMSKVWCPEGCHTVILCMGATDILHRSPAQVRDGILQLSEQIALASFKRTELDKNALPQQLIVYGMGPRNGKDNTEEAVEEQEALSKIIFELNTLLEEKNVNLQQYPNLASLKKLGMLVFVHDRLWYALADKAERHKANGEVYSTETKLNFRGHSILVQRILDDCLATWPGQNPPGSVLDWMNQLGLVYTPGGPFNTKSCYKCGGSGHPPGDCTGRSEESSENHESSRAEATRAAAQAAGKSYAAVAAVAKHQPKFDVFSGMARLRKVTPAGRPQ
ncbi:hypothetical protein DIPPA_06159 [Diplonema papillatum]|nr:hypothetical protein DIPPA_06159 [Diplonema papillatum]